MMSANITLALLKWLIAAFATGSLLGFCFRSRQLTKSRRRILELETEMVENHAEILRLHKIHSERNSNSGKVPVISLNKQEALSGNTIAGVKG